MVSAAIDIPFRTMGRPATKGRIALVPSVCVAVLLFLPPSVRYALGTSSNTPGLLVAAGVIGAAGLAHGSLINGRYTGRLLAAAVAAVLFLVVHLGVAAYLPAIVQQVDAARTLASLAAVAVLLVTAGVVADWWLEADAADLDRMVAVFRLLLVPISVWCFVGFQPPSPFPLVRPSFPFTEPSHFALVAAPFVIDGCVRATLVRRLLWLAVWLGLAFLNQSLSLMVAVGIAAIITLPVPYMIGAAAVVAVAATGLNLEYYTDRLDLSVNSENLSALVYRQGWELMQQGLAYSNGWGIGFQQLGDTPLNVPTSDIIYRILNDDSNLRDGSFLGAKLVSELGVFGIAVIVALVAVIARAAWKLRRMAELPASLQSPAVRLALAVLCGFTTEVFVRGIGYFSSTVVLTVAAALVLRHASGRSATARTAHA